MTKNVASLLLTYEDLKKSAEGGIRFKSRQTMLERTIMCVLQIDRATATGNDHQ